MMFGVIAFVGEHGLDAGHDSEGGEKQVLEDERVVDVGRGHGAGHWHAIPGTWCPAWPGLSGWTRARAATLGAHGTAVQDQVGVTAQHADQHGMDAGQQALSTQRAKLRHRVAPLAWSAVAVRLRHGVPSRRNRRKAASTRMVAVGG